MARAHGDKLQLFHATAPTCFWSWGYEAVFNRLPLVYGDQIDIHTFTFCVYDDYKEYLKEYELDWKGLVDWFREAEGLMGVPLAKKVVRSAFPKTQMPASLAVMAAARQGEQKGKRFARGLLRISSVEGKDATSAAAFETAAREAGLDLARFKRAVRNKKACEAAYEAQGAHLPDAPMGFYNIIVADGEKRMVTLNHAFDPAAVEGAIDYLAGGKLQKRKPSDVVGYLKAHGLAPTAEIARVFALARRAGQAKLAALERQGKVEKVLLAGAPHWRSA